MNYLKQGIHPNRTHIRSIDHVNYLDYLISSYPPYLYSYHYMYLRVTKKTAKRLTIMNNNNKITLYWDSTGNYWFSKKHNMFIVYFLKKEDLNPDECEMIP